MNLKEMLKELSDGNKCTIYLNVLGMTDCAGVPCSDCRKKFFAKALELLERDYVEKERDTLEKIEQDARLGTESYWKCSGVACTKCTALIEGKTPRYFYEVTACDRAKTLDLLRRQREILEGEQHAN